jgi:hypothetical protein
MNPIIAGILNINRFEFINISGSIVLNKILINNNISPDWDSNDLDIYISINNPSFTKFKCLDYMKEILTYLTQGIYEQNEFILTKLYRYALEISKMTTDAYINKIDDNAKYTSSVFHGKSYMNISNNTLGVIKLKYENIFIDFVFIDIEIDDYITQHFDLTIVQNYINYQNTIIQFGNINDIKQSISGFNLNKWDDITTYNKLDNMDNIRTNISRDTIPTFIDRIYKYNQRGFKIYLNHLKCSCDQINCLCTIKLDYDFIDILNQGYISFYNIYYGCINDLHTKKYCWKSKNHTDKCHGDYILYTSECGKEISYLKINNYKSKTLPDVYNRCPIVLHTIINKIVLLRELNIKYISNPDNLLNIFCELLE